jgi:hypothetical protein
MTRTRRCISRRSCAPAYAGAAPPGRRLARCRH